MVTIIDYKMINLGSIVNMLKTVGVENFKVASTPQEIEKASKIILPGIGSFDSALENLRKQDLISVLNSKAMDEKIPFLGICLGMQLMTNSSEEGIKPGLAYLNAEVRKFQFPKNHKLRFTHMGWNKAKIQKPHILFENQEPNRFYFVHSYFVDCHENNDILSLTDYGQDFVSAFARDNLIGVQFHPEKSHKWGLSLFKNFVEKC